MTDKTDPRRCVECGLVRGTDSEPQVHRYETDSRSDVLDRALYMAETAQAVNEADVLAAFDAADRAAGIVRVDTNDEALVDRVAQNWCVHEGVGKNCQPCWFDADNFLAALRAALRETP